MHRTFLKYFFFSACLFGSMNVFCSSERREEATDAKEADYGAGSAWAGARTIMAGASAGDMAKRAAEYIEKPEFTKRVLERLVAYLNTQFEPGKKDKDGGALVGNSELQTLFRNITELLDDSIVAAIKMELAEYKETHSTTRFTDHAFLIGFLNCQENISKGDSQREIQAMCGENINILRKIINKEEDNSTIDTLITFELGKLERCFYEYSVNSLNLKELKIIAPHNTHNFNQELCDGYDNEASYINIVSTFSLTKNSAEITFNLANSAKNCGNALSKIYRYKGKEAMVLKKCMHSQNVYQEIQSRYTSEILAQKRSKKTKPAPSGGAGFGMTPEEREARRKEAEEELLAAEAKPQPKPKPKHKPGTSAETKKPSAAQREREAAQREREAAQREREAAEKALEKRTLEAIAMSASEITANVMGKTDTEKTLTKKERQALAKAARKATEAAEEAAKKLAEITKKAHDAVMEQQAKKAAKEARELGLGVSGETDDRTPQHQPVAVTTAKEEADKKLAETIAKKERKKALKAARKAALLSDQIPPESSDRETIPAAGVSLGEAPPTGTTHALTTPPMASSGTHEHWQAPSYPPQWSGPAGLPQPTWVLHVPYLAADPLPVPYLAAHPVPVPYPAYQPPLPPEKPTTLGDIIAAVKDGEAMARNNIDPKKKPKSAKLAALVLAGFTDARLIDKQGRIGYSDTAPEVPPEGAPAEGTSEDGAPKKPTPPKN